jgi:hypothetical protein
MKRIWLSDRLREQVLGQDMRGQDRSILTKILLGIKILQWENIGILRLNCSGCSGAHVNMRIRESV